MGILFFVVAGGVNSPFLGIVNASISAYFCARN